MNEKWDKTEEENYWIKEYKRLLSWVENGDIPRWDKDFQEAVSKAAFHSWNHMRRLKALWEENIELPLSYKVDE